jgi:DNA polymerase-3 subunit alpha
MRQTLRSLAPTSFDDVAALVALYRPGPMAANMHRDYPELKNGRKELTYLHPDIEPILKDTYGLMLYQESVMRVAQKFAGYTLEEADNLRKACGKKIRAMIAKERESFVAGCIEQGYGEQLGTQLFDIIEPFADYAFNKSHSYGYGLVAYQTAWLKAHHPVEYMAALLTSVKDNKDKTAVYLAECRGMGIEVVVPDVNRSAAEFTPRRDDESPGAGIVFGLAAVRNVGESLVERIVAEREADGPFVDFYDFCRRVDPMVLNKRTMESLSKAGAFDSLGHPRQGLCLVLDEIVDRTLERRREHDVGIATLFSSVEPAGEQQGEARWEGTRIAIPEQDFDKSLRLAFEKEMLGLYVSDHPLLGLEQALGRHTDCSLAELRDSAGGADFDGGYAAEPSVRSVGGVVTELRRSYTKKGDLMARFVLEDLQASMEVFVFPRVMADYGQLLENDAVVVVRGRADQRDDQPKIVAMEVRRPVLTGEENAQLRIALPLSALTDETVARLKVILLEHPGGSPVLLEVGQKVLRLPPEFNVDSRNGLVGELKRLLGSNAIAA